MNSEHVGCYKPAAPLTCTTINSDTSIDNCLESCHLQGYQYALIYQSSSWSQMCGCFAENQLLNSEYRFKTACNKLCDSDMACGGKEYNWTVTNASSCTSWIGFSSTVDKGFYLYSVYNITNCMALFLINRLKYFK